MTEFKVGDKVRFKELHRPNDVDEDSIYMVDERAGHLVRLKNSRNPVVGWWSSYRLEHVQARVEGQKIAFVDIRVGDEIRVDKTMQDVAFSRQGTIARIGGYPQPTALYSASGIRLDYSHAEDTYTLIKAAPEKDEVLEKVTEQEDGAVVDVPSKNAKVLCWKDGEGWHCYFYSVGSTYKTDVDFAEWIRPVYDEVRWLG